MKAKHVFILSVITLLYIYNVYFFFLFTHFRKYLFAIGVLLFINHKREYRICIPPKIKTRLILAALFVALITALESIIGDFETVLLSIPLSIVINIFASFAIFYLACKWSKTSSKEIYDILLDCIFYAVIINNTIALFGLLAPGLYEQIHSIQFVPDSVFQSIGNIDSYRLGGLGDNILFTGGAMSALGLVIAVYKLCGCDNRGRKFTYLACLVYILFSGMLIARTTIIGIPLSFIVLKYYLRDFKTFFKYILISTVILALVVIVFIFLSEKLSPQMSRWAFEFYYNFKDSGEVSSDSTNDLFEMWTIIPDNLYTWILGDGKFVGDGGIGYYKLTDVGLMRIIFYAGLAGLFALLSLFKNSIYYAHTPPKLKMIEQSVFLWFFVMNLKGIYHPTMIAGLFFLINYCQFNKRIKHEA